ncbi:alpha/beta hydrolase [Marinobacter sp. CHS3-4]|uniref:alpha/beta fold hydrolase n=1 Tax=Marinobacter sp. CHS3-4 TaxID=3045174 RepID=UPI0024B492DD|nr:alpha/beta hydrolase [Marinobacter sp. CHS3-4]MDI9245513.1 alpha/beta hydrolase [Marinobacter sp. CHS3-4]
MNEVLQGAAPDSDSLSGQGVAPHEIDWPLRHLSLAGLHWPAVSQKNKVPVLMVHGWLDNAMSFAKLAPAIAEDRDVFALDLAGHGKSGHRAAGQGYPLPDYVADLAELVANHFDKEAYPQGIDLVGHSLGGIISLFYGAAFPERVRRLAMIDSLGPLSREPSEVIPQLRKAIRKRLAGSGEPVVYSSVEEAARAREGGMIPLSHQAAMLLVPRNLKQLNKEGEEKFQWSTDAELRYPSMMMMDEAQVTACLNAVKLPVGFLRAEKGLLASRPELDHRIDAIKGLELVSVPGGHHCHLEGDVRPVIHAVRNFIDVS